MDKKYSNTKVSDSNKNKQLKNTTFQNIETKPKKPAANKDVKPTTAPKKEGTKLNPIKPRGKNSEAEKQSLKRTNEKSGTRINKLAQQGKNAKKKKKNQKKNYIFILENMF